MLNLVIGFLLGCIAMSLYQKLVAQKPQTADRKIPSFDIQEEFSDRDIEAQESLDRARRIEEHDKMKRKQQAPPVEYITPDVEPETPLPTFWQTFGEFHFEYPVGVEQHISQRDRDRFDFLDDEEKIHSYVVGMLTMKSEIQKEYQKYVANTADPDTKEKLIQEGRAKLDQIETMRDVINTTTTRISLDRHMSNQEDQRRKSK